MDDFGYARELAYAELLLRCRRMAGLRACSDQDPAIMRFSLPW